jgi:hypothetical protein
MMRAFCTSDGSSQPATEDPPRAVITDRACKTFLFRGKKPAVPGDREAD